MLGHRRKGILEIKRGIRIGRELDVRVGVLFSLNVCTELLDSGCLSWSSSDNHTAFLVCTHSAFIRFVALSDMV